MTRKNKYGAIKTTVDGITFDSKREATRYQQLKLLQRAGVIRDLELQPVYPVVINGTKVCKIILDFRYYDMERNDVVIEDAKGRDTAVSRLKRKLLLALHGIDVRLV